MRFEYGAATQIYRLPISWDEAGAPDMSSAHPRIAALLDSLDDQRAVDDVVRSACVRVGSDTTPSVRHVIHVLLADLLSMGLLAVDGPASRVGSAATPLADRDRIVTRNFDRAHVEWRDAVAVAEGERARLPDVLFGSDGTTRSYRPPFRLRHGVSVDGETAARAVMALPRRATERRRSTMRRRTRSDGCAAPTSAWGAISSTP